MKLSGKTAVVTGGGSGIGLAAAEALAIEGCRVVIAGRSQERLRDAVAASKVPDYFLWRTVDVADRDRVEELFSWATKGLGKIDILINAAGINVPKRSMAEMVPEDWDRIFQVNTTGSYNCMRAVLPEMLDRGDGLIINISSIAGKRADQRGGVAYSASKFAQTALGLTVGAEVCDRDVRITNIYPGETNTPILDERPVQLSDEHLANILQPQDVAAAVVMVACLPSRARVPELVIVPTRQAYM